MKLDKKLEYALAHIEGILRHDDEPLAIRHEVAKELRSKIDAELTAAAAREKARTERILKRTAKG